MVNHLNNYDGPFPFITICLTLGAWLDLDTGSCSFSEYLGAGDFMWHLDTNDDCTVIDISDVTQVRYCFLLHGESRWLKRTIPICRPLNGRDFLQADRHDSDKILQSYIILLLALETVPLVEDASLIDGIFCESPNIFPRNIFVIVFLRDEP